MGSAVQETDERPHRREGGATGAVASWFVRTWNRDPLPLDIAVYAACLGYALLQALTSEFYGFRVWGNCAAVGYGLAALHSIWSLTRTRRALLGPRRLRSRWIPVASVGVFGMLLPLGILVVTRLTGGAWQDTPFSWSAQPEVWVIERAARLLLGTGTPYVDITALPGQPGVHDYTPYGPVMALFGLPDALTGNTPWANALTDARLYFALTAVVCVLTCLQLLGRPTVPVRAAQLAVVCPLTALTWAVAGPDLAVLGLVLLATALVTRGMSASSATVTALAVSAKLIALPAAVVLAVMTLATRGRRSCLRFVGTALAVCAAVNIPVLLVDPDAYFENVIQFPLGLGEINSPAASPLPGHLIASIGPAGYVLALVLLFTAASAVTVWLLRDKPGTASDAMLRLAVGLGAFALLAPASRFGYLLYPTVLLGAMLTFTHVRADEHASGPCPHDSQSA